MDTKRIHRIYSDHEYSARVARLMYMLDGKPGILRRKQGDDFVYLGTGGKRIASQAVIDRIEGLRIPPAWKNVWISPSPRGHLQATGTDKKGIKQYIYHPKWNALREVLKYYRLILFAEKLPALRQTISRHLSEPGMSQEKSVSAVLALMDQLSIRIGNEAYAENNKTYGLTTLRDKHAEVKGDTVALHFVGKSHQEHEFSLRDRRLARAVKKSQEIPGEHLFQYLDEARHRHPLTSNDVNRFLHERMGQDFSAKDFRTWIGTSHAYELMKREAAGTLSPDEYSDALKRVVEEVAEKLGNTAAVCKAHYIHSDLQDLFEKGELPSSIRAAQGRRARAGLKRHEAELQYILLGLYKEKIGRLRP